ncbi:hypothetical protein C0992_008881, partial [Termitomyces sp. T32_za158]
PSKSIPFVCPLLSSPTAAPVCKSTTPPDPSSSSVKSTSIASSSSPSNTPTATLTGNANPDTEQAVQQQLIQEIIPTVQPTLQLTTIHAILTRQEIINLEQRLQALKNQTFNGVEI